MLDRRSQLHLVNLSSNLSSSNAALQSRLQGLNQMVQSHGGGPSSPVPWALIQATISRQASMLSYMDCFWFLGVAILIMVPMAFLVKKSRPGGGMAVH